MPNKSALPYVFPAVLGLLNVSAITSTLGCAVLDHVPQGQVCPYIVLQSPTENRDDRMGRAGKNITIQAHVHTSSDQVEGSGQVQDIVSKIEELTEYPSLNLTGSGFVATMCRSEDVIDAGDEV